MSILFRFAVIALAALSSAVSAQTANPYALPTHAAPAAAMDKGPMMDDLKPFMTEGARILESRKGDLTGDGKADVVLVLDPPAAVGRKLGEGPSRIVLILVRDEAGHLHKAASNSHVVPCATCGGVAGDPFGYVKLENGTFTIVNGGGSRERWSDEYTFTYSIERRDWIVSRVVRKVTDTESGEVKRIELGARELGNTPFKDFDPSSVQEVSLP